MLIIPVQGVIIKSNKIISMIIRAYTARQLAEIMGISLKDDKGKDIYFERIDIVDKEKLALAIDLRNENSKDAMEILEKYKDCSTFALLDVHANTYVDIFDLKVALSILYIANRWGEEREKSFFKQVLLIRAYFSDECLRRTDCGIKIGDQPFNQNDFELTISKHYTSVEYNTKTLGAERINGMIIKKDISDQVVKLCKRIVGHSQSADSMRSALNLLYSTLAYSNIDVIIPTYATILETLLLKKNEDNQRKIVAIRAACLIANNGNIEEKRYVANWVYHFYELRNKIVHDGVSHFELRLDSNVCFEHTVSLIGHLIYNLIKVLAESEIKAINDIKRVVEDNKKQDGLNNGFDYIDEKLIMYYEMD